MLEDHHIQVPERMIVAIGAQVRYPRTIVDLISTAVLTKVVPPSTPFNPRLLPLLVPVLKVPVPEQ